MITQIVFLPHLKYVRDQTFEPTSNRAHTYYIRSRIVVSLEDGLPQFSFENEFPDGVGII